MRPNHGTRLLRRRPPRRSEAQQRTSRPARRRGKPRGHWSRSTRRARSQSAAAAGTLDLRPGTRRKTLSGPACTADTDTETLDLTRPKHRLQVLTTDFVRRHHRDPSVRVSHAYEHATPMLAIAIAAADSGTRNQLPRRQRHASDLRALRCRWPRRSVATFGTTPPACLVAARGTSLRRTGRREQRGDSTSLDDILIVCGLRREDRPALASTS